MNADNIISALVGLAGACSSNPKTEHTDALVREALAASRLCAEGSEEAVKALVARIHAEKDTIAPGCARCPSPCGNTSDYDMRRLYEAQEGIRAVKLRLLERLQDLAAKETCPDSTIFYKTLIYIGCDMEETVLRALLKEIEETERIQNHDQTDHSDQ